MKSENPNRSDAGMPTVLNPMGDSAAECMNVDFKAQPSTGPFEATGPDAQASPMDAKTSSHEPSLTATPAEMHKHGASGATDGGVLHTAAQSGTEGPHVAPPKSVIPLTAVLDQFVGAEHVLTDISLEDPRLPPHPEFTARLKAECGPDGLAGCSLIAIECGLQGQYHLVAACFRSKESKADFLNRNPKLRGGLQTSWYKSDPVWLKILGPVPRNLEAGSLTWWSEGLVAVALTGQPASECVIQEGVIPVIPFASLQWPTEIETKFEAAELEQIFGPLATPVEPKKFALNLNRFPEEILRRYCMFFNEDTKSFERYRSEIDGWERISEDNICRLVVNALVDISSKCPDQVPSSEIKPQLVKLILWRMRMQASVLPGQAELVERFFSEGIRNREGAHLTSEESYSGFKTYCKVRDLSPCGAAFFYRQMTRKFGRASHCFGKDGTKRGRCGLELNWAVINNHHQPA